jgi:predicted RND superfamily exporter protein
VYINFLIRRRKQILVCWAVFLLTSLALLSHKLLLSDQPTIDNSVSVWFDQKDQNLLDYQSYNHLFGEEEWSLLLLQTDSIYSPEFLTDLDSITADISALRHVIKTTSITNVRDNFTSDDGLLDYRRIYSDLVSKDTVANRVFRQQLERNPIFERNLILHDNDEHTIILIQNANLIDDQSAYRIELVDSIYAILDRHKSIKNYALAGTTVVNAELNRAAKLDVVVFYSLVTVLLTGIAFLILRSIRNLVAMYAVVVTSALPTMGLLAALKIPFNMVTVMLPTILIALSVAGVVHIITEFHSCRITLDSKPAMQQTLYRLYKPTLWTTLTTIAGFGAFTTSQVYPVFQLGAFAAFGLALACFANLVIVPILLLTLWPDRLKSPSETRQSRLFFALSLKTVRTSGVFVLLPVIALSVYGLTRLEVDTNYIEFFSSSHPTTQSYERIKQVGFAQNPVVIHVSYDNEQSYSSDSVFAGTLALEKAIKQQPEVVKVLSSSDFLNQIDLAFNGDNGQVLDQYDQSKIEQLLLLGELSGNDDISDFIVEGSTDVQIIAMTIYMSSRKLTAFKNKLYELKEAHLPVGASMQITGTTVLWANMDSQVSHTQFLTLILLTGFLAVFLPVIFGSIRLGLVGLLINTIPLAVTLGCMSLLDIKINIATALIGGISIGVVVDDTIHLISRIIFNRRNGYSIDNAIDEALQSIGKSIMRTTLILVIGFSCMATSEFLPTAHFGIFISLSMVLALILDIVYLPALLKTFPWLARNSGVSLLKTSHY